MIPALNLQFLGQSAARLSLKHKTAMVVMVSMNENDPYLTKTGGQHLEK